jgi:hypothetical protein
MNAKDKKKVFGIVHLVKVDDRTESDLCQCGCRLCKEALEILRSDKK